MKLLQLSMSEGSSYFDDIEEAYETGFEDGEIKDVDTVESFSKHKGGSRTPAEIILNSDAKILICGNLGQKAVYMLRESDMEVFSGASGKVEEILKNWQDGKLIFADENSCDEKSC